MGAWSALGQMRRPFPPRTSDASGEHVSNVGQPERATQDRVVALFRNELGYRYLGDWTDRDSNSNIEEGLLSTWLTGRGYSAAQIGVALHKLRTEAANQNRTLYGNNQAVYSLLRYGVPVKVEAGKDTEGLQYGSIGTPEKYFLKWKEDEADNSRFKLDTAVVASLR